MAMAVCDVTDTQKAIEALGRLHPSRADDRETWLHVGMALHATSDELLAEWKAWSSQSAKYVEVECDRQWKGFKAGKGITLATLLKMAHDDDPAGDREPRRSPRPRPARKQHHAGRPTRAMSWGKIVARVEHVTAGKYSTHWVYRDAAGGEVLRIIRCDAADGSGKDYRPVHSAGSDGWAIGDPDGLLPLYNLPQVLQSDYVVILEGEKCCDLASGIGLVATTSAHGASSAARTDWSPLAGKTVTIYPDNDDAGRKYAADVAGILAALDPPAAVAVVNLPVPRGQDLEQWLQRFDSAEPEAIRNALQALPAKMAPGSTRPIVVQLCDVETRPVEWLWPGRIALGRLTLIAGDPGLGKSMLSLYLASVVTMGYCWPDDPAAPTEPGQVILMSAEDDPADTIRPRCEAAGADLSRIAVLPGQRRSDRDGRETDVGITIADLDSIEATIRARPGTRLLVVDPVSAYLGRTDSHKNSDVRGLLAPLAQVAGRYQVAVVMVSHLSKGAGLQAIYRAMGSLAFVAAARAAFLVAPDPEDRDRRLFVQMKNNLAPEAAGLAFRVRDGALVWEPGSVDTTADQVLAAGVKQAGRRAVRDSCQEWLEELLAGGPLAVKDVEQQALDAGFALRTLRRASDSDRFKRYPMPGVKHGPWLLRLHGLPNDQLAR